MDGEKVLASALVKLFGASFGGCVDLGDIGEELLASSDGCVYGFGKLLLVRGVRGDGL